LRIANKLIPANQNELYITTSSDINPLASINGKARVMSHPSFLREFPGGKIPRSSPAYNKTFVCRRGCNTRTTTYTSEFIWEEVFSGSSEDITKLIRLVQAGTKSTRKQPKSHDDPATTYTPRKKRLKDIDEDEEVDIGDDEDASSEDGTQSKLRTPRKRQKTSRISTPSSRK
jgi:origin recognition complex subunit 1